MRDAKLYVEFSRNNGQTNELRQRLGPYRVVQLKGDELLVFDGFQPLVLATRDNDAEWTICGLDGLFFDSVLIREV